MVTARTCGLYTNFSKPCNVRTVLHVFINMGNCKNFSLFPYYQESTCMNKNQMQNKAWKLKKIVLALLSVSCVILNFRLNKTQKFKVIDPRVEIRGYW